MLRQRHLNAGSDAHDMLMNHDVGGAQLRLHRYDGAQSWARAVERFLAPEFWSRHPLISLVAMHSRRFLWAWRALPRQLRIIIHRSLYHGP